MTLPIQLFVTPPLTLPRREVRSSLHYDPYQNLLAVAAGAKGLTLFPPSATPLLYPHSLAGASVRGQRL